MILGKQNTLSQNGSSVTVTPTGNFSGEGQLTVTANNDCGTTTATKTIQTGAQRPIIYDENGEQVASFTFCMLNYDGISFETPPGAVEWEWRNISNNFSMTANNNYASFYNPSATSGIVDVRVRDNCGWSARTLLFINLTNCSGSGFQYMAYPNPATDVLNITETTASNYSESTTSQNMMTSFDELPSSATLFDFNGNPVQTISPAVGNMNIQSLAPGHYILIVSFGEESESHHILIQ